MTKVLALLAVIECLVSCASDVTFRPTAAQIPGTYYSGDGLGRNVSVVLSPHGTFAADWEGCLGVYGKAGGTWQLHDDQIRFVSSVADGDLAGYLTEATTIKQSGRLGFVRAQNVQHDRVSEELLFLKQASRP